MWCIADLEYEFTESKNARPWILSTLKPIQLSHFDFDGYVEARRQFTTGEWIDLLMQSIGFNPEMFGKRSKLIQLLRLIPFCERNYNLIELGPKGTGKSHIYSEFSPHGILISGGEVTVPKLFVNNASGKIGLVGYWDCIAFDEFAGKQKRVDKAHRRHLRQRPLYLSRRERRKRQFLTNHYRQTATRKSDRAWKTDTIRATIRHPVNSGKFADQH